MPCPAPGRRGRGFTLLELLLVLSLMALLAGLVAPRAWQAIVAAQERAALDEARGRLAALGTQALLAGRPISVVPASRAWGLPEGWRLEAQPASLRFEPNGMTRGGRVQVWHGDHLVAEWVVEHGSGALREAGARDLAPAPA